MSGPAASVIMPAYRAARFLAEALAALWAQTLPDFEVIAVDDGSTDGTAAILADEAEREPRLRVLTLPHGGVAAARNAGLAAATAPLVTFLDADDLWRPDRLARHVALLAARPEVDLVAGEVLVFEALDEAMAPRAGSDHVRLRAAHLGAVTFRRSVFDRIGIFDPAMRFSEDLDLLLRAHEAGLTFHTEDAVALLHRRHEGNMTADAETTRRFILRAIGASVARRRAPGFAPPAAPFPLQTAAEAMALSPAMVGRRNAGAPA